MNHTADLPREEAERQLRAAEQQQRLERLKAGTRPRLGFRNGCSEGKTGVELVEPGKMVVLL